MSKHDYIFYSGIGLTFLGSLSLAEIVPVGIAVSLVGAAMELKQ